MNRKVYAAAALVLTGLLVGASVEHIRLKTQLPEPTVEDQPEIIHHVRSEALPAGADSGAQEKMIAALNSRVAELTAELAKARSARQAEGETVQVEQREGDRDGRKRESWEERIERMKKEEPERYAEMQKHREEFKARMEERKQSKREFFESINTASMNDEQRQSHERLVALNERINEIGELMMSGQAENRSELRQELFDSLHELRELNSLERVYLLEQTANAAGYQGDDAALFTEHIESIIENTTLQGPPHGMGGPPRGGDRGGRERGSDGGTR